MNRITIFTAIACSLLICQACNNPSRKSGDGFEFQGKDKLADIEVTKSFIYLFPSPGEVLERFYDADLSYVQELLHDPGKFDTYMTSRDKALNLGVYLTDMAYTALFNRSTEAVDYLDVIQKLSSDLNVSTTTFESLMERAKDNIGNRDSLVTISNEVFYNMIEFLENSGQETTVAVISCGAYVESMYISLNSIENYDPNDPILKQVDELKYPMENLMSHAESVSEDPNVKSILNYIKDLNEVFAQLESEGTKATVSEPGVINLSGGSPPDLNEENFDEMKKKVIDVRTVIVEK